MQHFNEFSRQFDQATRNTWLYFYDEPLKIYIDIFLMILILELGFLYAFLM